MALSPRTPAEEQARGVIARSTGILLRSPESAQHDLMSNITPMSRSFQFFRDPSKVKYVTDSLYKLLSRDEVGNDAVYKYIDAMMRTHSETLAEDEARTELRARRYPGGPGYKRSEAHGRAVPITPHGSYAPGSYSNLTGGARAHARYEREAENTASRQKNYTLSRIQPTSGTRVEYKPKNVGRGIFKEPNITGALVSYAGGDKPINYKPPNFMASGVARQVQTTAARMGTYTRDDFQMHEPIKLANGRTMYIPSHLTTSSSRLRDWIVKEYVENKDPNVRILIDYAEEHRLQGQGLGNEFHKGLASAEIHIAREMSKPKWKEGPKEPKYEYRRNTFGDRMFKPLPSATERGKLRDPITGKRLVVGKMRGWGGDALREKIPYGQFRGMRVGDLLNPILKTHRNKKTGKRYQSTAHEAIYYVAGMKNSEWVKQSFPEFHAIIHHYFTHNPAMRDLLAPYETTNYFGGRSPADLRIKYNPYRPSTWGHGHNVSLRDDDLPYYDRWASADRAHKLGYNIRKQTPQWVDEEISLVLKSTLPGWMKRRMIADISQAEEGQETRRTVAQKSWSRLKGLREKEQGVHWAPDPENEGNFIRVKGPKEISTREQRIEKLVERMNVKQGRMLLNVGRIQAASDKYDIQEEMGGVIGKGRRVEMFTQQERERRRVEDPFTEVEHQMLSGARVRSQKKGDMSKARPVPKNFEELLAARLSYQRKIDWVVKNGGTLEQLQNLAEDVETTVPGGWPALDRAQGLVDFNKVEGGAPDDVYPTDPEAEIYQTDTSLRGYFFKARALIMARK